MREAPDQGAEASAEFHCGWVYACFWVLTLTPVCFLLCTTGIMIRPPPRFVAKVNEVLMPNKG